MAGTRNGQRQGMIPFPGQYKPVEFGTPEQKSAPKPPAGDELADRLSTILEDMSEGQDDDLAPPAPPPGTRRRIDAGRAEPQFKVAQPEVNLGWLRRCVDNGLEGAKPARQKQKGWSKWSGRLAPVIALLALLALYPAFRYILAAGPPNTQTAASVAGQQPGRIDAATPAPNAKRQQRVPTIQVTPRQTRAAAAPDVARLPAMPAPAVAVVQPAAPPPVALPPAAAVVQPAVPQPKAPPSFDSAAPQRTARISPPNQGQLSEEGTLDPADAALLERGKKMMAYGDVAGARLAYSYLADRGSASGALALAESYDPELLSELSVIGLSGNRQEAIKYYRRAAELGSLEAARRLTKLLAAR